MLQILSNDSPVESNFSFLFPVWTPSEPDREHFRTGCLKNQPLTAPIVMPWVKYFWKIRNTMMMGTAASAAPAMIRP